MDINVKNGGWRQVFVVLIVALVSPLVLSTVTIHAAREDREADWKRQDLVAAKVAAVATAVKESSTRTDEKLDVIHTLVNSNMTAAMQSEYDAVVVQLAMMREVIDLKRAAGKPPGESALTAIVATETKLSELKARLADRQRQAETASKIETKTLQPAPK